MDESLNAESGNSDPNDKDQPIIC